MPLLCADRLLLAPNDPLQDLPGLRHDEPLSRKRWQFGDRIEHYGVIERQEGEHVSEQNPAQA